MTNLQELIDTANRLSNTLESISNEEKKWCVDLQLTFERMSWQCYCLANELQEIKNYI